MFPSTLRSFLLATLFLLAPVAGLRATPPVAPSNGTFTHTHYGPALMNGSTVAVAANKRHTWFLNWQDNANDENGYVVSVRYGTVGPFTTFGILPADTTSFNFSISNLETTLTIPVQFKIEAWKHNGTATESSTLSMTTIMPKPVAVADQVYGPPTILTAALVDKDPTPATTVLSDGLIKIDWQDLNNSELGYEIQAREAKPSMTDNDWFSFGNVPPNTTTFTVSNQFDWFPAPGGTISTNAEGTDAVFIPGKHYQFRVRATRGADAPTNFKETPSATDGVATTPQALLIPSLLAPADLAASPADETQLRLTWTDKSDNETGYVIEYRFITSGTPPAFTAFPEVMAENTTSVVIPAAHNATAEFQVRALFAYTPSGTTTETKLYSAYTASAQSTTTTFAGPTELTATPSSGLGSTIDLSWEDNSSTESGFDIMVKPVGGNNFKFARAVRSNITQVSLDSIAGTVGSDGRPISRDFVKLTPGTTYEFVVRAVGNDETTFSTSSNIVTATPREGFTMPRLYHPAKVGEPFKYQLTVSTTVERTSWNAAPLPAGLVFDNVSGLISGTPTVSGVFVIPLTATFANSVTASTALTLRILALPGSPTVTAAIPDTTVSLTSPAVINLADKFTDPGAEKAARLETVRGNLDLMLYPSLAPEAVANFLAYVDAGDYDGLAFHRLAYSNATTPFVLQGGNMKVSTAPRNFTSVGKRESPTNEPGMSNLRGTISAAKIGGRSSSFTDGAFSVSRDESYGYVGLPNSATTDFFLNPVNNAANLDNQNGGFTAYGQLTNASLLILDQICALPRGSYADSKSIFIDGSSVPVSDFPINAGAAPADMDNTKAVKVIKASSVPVLSYTVDVVSANKATVVVENDQLKITGLAAGTRAVNVTARDLDGNTVSQAFTINVTPGFQPPAITKQPVSVTVNVAASTKFSVTATGTGLSYQWRRGGANITGKTDATLTLTNVQAGDSGLYDVVVTAGGRSVTSSSATLAVRVPADITSSLPNELLVEVGQPIDLSVNVTGSPAPTLAWKRGTTVLKGQNAKRLLISSVTLANAGLYTATATNGSTDKSNTCNVLIVDKGTRTVAAAPGKPVKLTAPAAGPFVSYSWRKAGQLINQAGFTGTDKATLSIAAAQFNTDSGDYTCVLTPPGALPVTTTGIVHLAVSNIPQLGTLAAPNGFIGDGYSYTLPYSASDANTPSSFSITGLPPGLTFNTATGVISGRPTKAGTYTITAKASNPAGTGTAVTGTLRILAPSAAGAGTYTGIINPRESINANKGGRLDLTVTDNAAWSARLVLGKDSYSLKGSILIKLSAISGSSSLVYGAGVNFTSKTGQPLALYFEVSPTSGDVTGFMASNTETADVTGYRLFWSATRNGCPFTGLYNIALTQPVGQAVQQDVPQGDGYMTLTTTPAGAGSIAGRLPDGSTITSSAPVGSAGQTVLFQMLYKNTGSLLARMGVTTARDANSAETIIRYNSYNGSARWIKDVQPAAERNYQPGFGSTLLELRGWAYQPPKAEVTPIVMNLPSMAGNVRLNFNEGGLAGASRDPDLTFRLNNSNLADFTGVTNPAKVTLKVIPGTGAYSGTFELEDNGTKRPVTFQGLIIPAIASIAGLDAFTINNASVAAQAGRAPTASFGAGYFLLDKLPVAPSTKSTALLSGSARLGAPDIIITTQPVSQTVNPGANVTFTCAATGGLGATPALTYQWRRNGVNLGNATGSVAGVTTPSLVLTNVLEGTQGSFDCVVRKNTEVPASGSIPAQTFTDTGVTTTQVAELTVNDPVSDILILQNPSRSVVPTSTVVTFTAEHKGTGPFTYQWLREGVNIDGATAVTYTTPPVGNDQAGNYTVKVTSDISAAGVVSAAKNLAHAAPVTTVSIARSPDSQLVASGTKVVFTATNNGTNPTYQWLKNDIAITGAESATFTINSVALSDTANYKVLVTSSASPDTITSNELNLNVTPNLSNITITPSFAGTAAPINTDVTLTAASGGIGPFNFQWRKNGVNIPGAVTNVLAINTGAVINMDNPDSYDVQVSTAVVPNGVLSSPFLLRVAEPISNVIASRTPTAPAVTVGTTVVFSVSFTGSSPTYQWRKDGTNIENATGPTYTIGSFAESDEGDYSVFISNAVTPNGVSSNNVTVTTNAPVTAATIILVSPGSPNVGAGSVLIFNASAEGGNEHAYQWRKNNVDIPGATTPVLNTTADDFAGSAVYDVRVSNPLTPAGIYSNQITITVQ